MNIANALNANELCDNNTVKTHHSIIKNVHTPTSNDDELLRYFGRQHTEKKVMITNY